ncbi:hypothetical protein [Porphyromonas macacae]|uniref:hypothetical protein n=1 Tax=Porphyromonas macacae TaxID=28115 RepID=UPI0024AE7D7C|nr:hypothetical protein [Porphyromonas macacae]
MVTDKDMMEKGFTSLHECVNDLDAPTRIFEYDRLEEVVGRKGARKILTAGYERVVAKVSKTGEVVYRKVNEFGYIIRGNAGKWP